jgi:cyclopropane fatty-acyl-phospholipid synthase-like methyltransferase
MRPFVARCLERATLRCGAPALEMGCGTGPLSCQLAEAGLDVIGVDISPTAIVVARGMAARRKLPIAFAIADVCHWPFAEETFDLIVDGHLLHCIVFVNERRALLENVRRSLTDDGEFWLETMMLADGWEANPDWHLDARGVVWSPIGDRGAQYADAEQRDGTWWLPQRLIARSADQVLHELHAAGLRVIEHESYVPSEPRAPGGFRARCARGDG